MNVEKIRRDFPIFNLKVSGKKLIYFDNAATTQKPKCVINKIKEFYEKFNANVHRGLYKLSEEASELYEEAHRKVADFINADWREIIFTKNATESINLVAYSYFLNELKKNDKILISIMEHHSNIVPWQFVSKRKGCKLEYVYLKDYEIDLENFKSKINKNTRLVSITYISNVLGSENNVKEIVKIAKENGAMVLLDVTQAINKLKINVKKLDVDFLVFSSHKMLGPTGIGVLYGKKEILERMEPFIYGGDMVRDVDFLDSYWNELPWKFEAGTPNVADALGFVEAIKYLEKIGIKRIEKYLQKLTKYFLNEFSKLKSFKIIGKESFKKRTSIFSFIHDKLNPNEIAKILDKEGIAIRSGYHCAIPLMRYLGLYKTGGTARASLYIYNTKEEIDRFIEVLARVR
ncbi:MAG: SufS family cysteine desulfurase [Candidatus Aenigmatarchaeota archaeon]